MSLKGALKAGQKCNSKGYYDSYKDNIYKQTMPLHYQDMFDHGSGGEIHSKAEAVHSSSMLSYNLLHWIDINNPFEFNGVVYTKVYFEVQMRTLSCRCNPANMDVVLEGTQIGSPKKHLLFVESKFTEYLENNKFNLSDSYTKNNNWYNNNIDWGKVLSQTQDVLKKQKGYGEGIKQAITHLYGILGLWNKDALNWFNKNNGNLIILPLFRTSC